MVEESAGPSPRAANTYTSIAARNAAVRWNACKVSKIIPGLGALPACGVAIVSTLLEMWVCGHVV